MSNQITEVRLLSVPLENDYKHTLYFSSREEQTAYFTGRTVFNDSNFSYQRKDHIIRYPKHYDELSSCNYVMYRNSSSLKWNYAFITEKTYINDERTDISIVTDVLQTYHFDYTVKPSFVEREHTNNDAIGYHTYPENLECGEFISTYSQNVTDLTKLRIIVGVTEPLKEEFTGGRYNGVYSGIYYYGFREDAIAELNNLVRSYDEEGKSDAIQNMFLAPEFISKFSNEQEDDKEGKIIESEHANNLYLKVNKDIRQNLKLGYEPKNNKLYTYPYKYMLLSNNNGASAVYKYEDFDYFEMEFNIYGVLTPGCSIRIIPTNYKGVDFAHEEGLNLGKYPICNWNSDVYTNWLTQNGLNIGVNVGTGVLQIAGGVAAGVIGGGATGWLVGSQQIAGGVSTIMNQIGQVSQMSFAPPQSKGNTNCGDVITAIHNNTFTIYAMSIKDEYMKIIDNFFSMFGYKCNTLKTPLKNHRENYWYTKTIDVSIDGNITSGDMQTIKNCYNSGVTFWKNPSNIGDYTVSNNITV